MIIIIANGNLTLRKIPTETQAEIDEKFGPFIEGPSNSEESQRMFGGASFVFQIHEVNANDLVPWCLNRCLCVTFQPDDRRPNHEDS